jgi:Flp pilus assembly pilin Flp
MQTAVREDREWDFFWELAMKVVNTLKRFGRDDRGMETVEWAVMAAILVAGLVGVIGGIGTNVLTKFTSLQTATH